MRLSARERRLVKVAEVVPIKIDPFDVKFAIRTEARESDLYRIPVELEWGGKAWTSEHMPKNLGQWLFGIPYYKGHYLQEIRHVNGETVVIIRVPDIDEVKKLINFAIDRLVEKGIVKRI